MSLYGYAAAIAQIKDEGIRKPEPQARTMQPVAGSVLGDHAAAVRGFDAGTSAVPPLNPPSLADPICLGGLGMTTQ